MKDRARRFWRKVDKHSNKDGCWLWMGQRLPAGYGRVSWKGRKRLAHRVAYELEKGPIPAGNHHETQSVRHLCDNPPCVNPAHLRLGSHRENMADRNTAPCPRCGGSGHAAGLAGAGTCPRCVGKGRV